ncbi:MAG: undecaprenyl-diphosphate phosphatase [Oscillospiraceae bacterium]|nr:undecaprenyl-diphosphate phosphatase [Oscillospiraceae bacterium]
MAIWKALLLGLLQGLAEFLPVSSSGHLALFEIILGLGETPLLFDVCLHIGTLAAVFIVFRKDVRDLLNALARMFKPSERRAAAADPNTRLAVLLIVATLPLLIAIPFKGAVESIKGIPALVGAALIVTALILKLTDYIRKGKKNERTATVTDAVVVGVMQALAITPGLSRSGLTISGGIFRGFDRQFAFRFSFLLSIPAVLGATLIELIEALVQGFDPALILPMIFGMAVAFVSGFFALKLLRKLLLSEKFSHFAWYCLAAGALTVILSLILSK